MIGAAAIAAPARPVYAFGVLRAPTDDGLGLRLLVERAGREFPSRRIVTRISGGTTELTYDEFGRRVRRLASALRARGIGEGDRVATFAWNTHRHLELAFAVPCLGAVLETLNVRFATSEVERLLERSSPRLLFVDDDLLDRAPGVPDGTDPVVLANAYDELLASGSESFELPVLDELLPATACYTSSTTGAPKCVEYSHRSLVLGALVLNQPGVAPLHESDRVLPIVSLFHANAWGFPLAAMLSGADLVLPGAHPTSEEIARLIESERVTKAAAVPTVFDALLDVGSADLSSLTEIYCAGAVPPQALTRAFEERFGVQLVHAWGMTETCFFGLVSRTDDLALRAAQGRAVPLLETRLAANGELEVHGPAVAGAYRERDDSARYTPDGWLRTGDVAIVASDRFLRLVDRLQDTIKSGGEWIHSLALELLISEVEGVEEVAVVPISDSRYGERPYAFVVMHAGRTLDADLLREHLAGHVPAWWIPDLVELVDSLPRTGTGKVDKRALRASLTEEHARRRVPLRGVRRGGRKQRVGDR